MHELSIVNSLIELCEKIAKEHNANKVLHVKVKIGKLSGIEPHFFQTTFDTFKDKTICENATLMLNVEKIKIACFNCAEVSFLDKNEFMCPKCGSNEIQTKAGEDMILESVELE